MTSLLFQDESSAGGKGDSRNQQGRAPAQRDRPHVRGVPLRRCERLVLIDERTAGERPEAAHPPLRGGLRAARGEQATFTAGDATIEATAGQIVVVPAGTPHKFVNSGTGGLRQTSIHANERMVTEWLEEG